MDIILFWNAVAMRAIRTDYTTDTEAIDPGPDVQQPGPTHTSHAMAMVHIGMFNAFSTGPTWQGFASAPAGMTVETRRVAVSKAARDLLVDRYSAQAATFDAEYVTALAQIGRNADVAAGEERGAAAAAAVLAARVGDGSNAPDGGYAQQPEVYKHDESRGNFGFAWGNVLPFCVANVTTHLPGVPWNPAQYAIDHAEVRVKGSVATPAHNRNPVETEIGLFWAYDGARNIGVPPLLYNQVVRAIVATKGDVTEETNARLFAVVNVALADAGIQCWAEKYHFRLWRPDLGITNPGNHALPTPSDPNWRAFGAPTTNQRDRPAGTPPFPAYPSGHATFGAASLRAAELVLALPEGFTFDFTSDELDGVAVDTPPRPDVAVTHRLTIDTAIRENLESRVFLGVHWRLDGIEGDRNGRVVGELVAANFPARIQA
ncbi:MAG: vanadium-dependent haloperoxidase [Myxococcota bacterium]